jgi:hypothetical protein
MMYWRGLMKWAYVKKGPYWNALQDGTHHWKVEVNRNVPNEWLRMPVDDLIKVRNRKLENLVLERPVIRTESGPLGVRWARSSAANPYILGREMIMNIQNNGNWKYSPGYLGNSRNVQTAALRQSNETDVSLRTMDGPDAPWYVATHGDDWIAWCPYCERWHSGDWSNFDLRIGARQILASYNALYRNLRHFLTKAEKKLFYALAYFAIRTPTLWLWRKDGSESLSIRATLGHVRSGSGEFIMAVNNALNWSALQMILEKTHKYLRRKGKRYPCRSRSWWKAFSQYAAMLLGWLAKPSAQLTHPHGFLACRCVHTREDAFTPRPSITSVMRNWVNCSYDPEEYPNSTRLWMIVRFRELNDTMAWAPKAVADRMMECVTSVAGEAGEDEPYGLDKSERELSHAVHKVVGSYNTRAYLESRG